MQAKKVIPEKLFFKIGEVCELVEVEPHVLRYWEQEFSQLTPQKNRAGQRVYRRRDVEIAMRIKALREEEGFTIAGAKKRLATEMRASSKLKVVPMERPVEPVAEIVVPAVVEPEPDVVGALVASLETGPLSPPEMVAPESTLQAAAEPPALSLEAKAALRRVRTELEALLTILR